MNYLKRKNIVSINNSTERNFERISFERTKPLMNQNFNAIQFTMINKVIHQNVMTR